MDFVGNLVTFFSALFAVLSRENGTISAEEAGLSISYAVRRILQCSVSLSIPIPKYLENAKNFVAVSHASHELDDKERQ